MPELAGTTLALWRARRGPGVDDFRDEEPGKILHELRFGELTAFGERPHSPYFGSADSTPLFLILLDEYERWTGDADVVRDARADGARGAGVDRRVRRPRRRRLHRVRRAQRRDRPRQPVLEGLVELDPLPRRRARTAAARDAARSRATPTTPRCVPPGWPARSGATPALADRLEREAAELKRALQPRLLAARRELLRARARRQTRRQVDSLTSNIGHLLWSGIVDDDKAPTVVEHLMSDALFSGWGVRTMARGRGRLQPDRLPRRHGLAARQLAHRARARTATATATRRRGSRRAMLEAARYFDYRLPEAFAGYARERTQFPVEYPTACSPQAWATGAPLLLSA